MQLGITIPLQRYLRMKAPDYGLGCDLFFCWELHTILLQRSRTLVAVNANNRFAVVLSNMTRLDWEEFPERFLDGLRAALGEEGYRKQQIDEYFARAGAAGITKTHGRRSVAALNVMDDYLWSIPVPIDPDQLYQSIHTQEANRQICRTAGFEERGRPVDLWQRDMERFFSQKK